MTDYAINELPELLKNVSSPIDMDDKCIRYICSLVSELAYYYIPKNDLDSRFRGVLLPCSAYRELIKQNHAFSINSLLARFEIFEIFEIVDRSFVAVGIAYEKLLIIGFRGTKFGFDWSVNKRTKLTEINRQPIFLKYKYVASMNGGLHEGFAEEANRISNLIRKHLDKFEADRFTDIILTGHSLGGAVASISDLFIQSNPSNICIFGTPRYANLPGYGIHLFYPPTHIRREGDLIPTLPLKSSGYIDHPLEYKTNGEQYFDLQKQSGYIRKGISWSKFCATKFDRHDIEHYRHELGNACGANLASNELTDKSKLEII